MIGPVALGVDATEDAFKLYKSGVIAPEDCGLEPNHGVLAVGFGTEDGRDYYLVKNSWGVDWGDKGFVKIAAEAAGHGACGI